MSNSLFQIEIRVAATMYIRAPTKAAAQALAQKHASDWIDHGGEYDLADDGSVYLSPAMTMMGFFDGQAKVEKAEEI